MQEREARLLSESGELDKIIIKQAEENVGWTIKLVSKSGSEQMLHSKRSKSPRIFKTSDASLRCCQRIGVNEAYVLL